MNLAARLSALLGISAYSLPASPLPGLDDPSVESIRESLGGQIQVPATSQTRWYLADLEAAEHAADTGWMASAARLMRACRKDGVLAGVLSTRTGGLVRLPKRFRGRADMVAALELGHDRNRSVFDEMFPATELALLAGDGMMLGVGVAELVEVKGRDFPIMIRLDPEFLIYRWNENRWYFRSVAGLIPITPGDGKWILHTPGGRTSPWQNGLWRCLGRAYIRKEHANLFKDNWEAKLANPARVAMCPTGAAQEQKEGWFQKVAAWGVNTVFGVPPGFTVGLLESNGRGYDSFNKTIADQNNEITIAIAGQTVTTDGGAGFQNSDIHKSIRADLIKETADGLAYTINTQGIPPWAIQRWGIGALVDCAVVEWDVTPPKDRKADADAMLIAAQALNAWVVALAAAGNPEAIDVKAYCTRFGIPIVAGPAVDAAIAPVVQLARAGATPTATPNDDEEDDDSEAQYQREAA